VLGMDEDTAGDPNSAPKSLVAADAASGPVADTHLQQAAPGDIGAGSPEDVGPAGGAEPSVSTDGRERENLNPNQKVDSQRPQARLPISSFISPLPRRPTENPSSSRVPSYQNHSAEAEEIREERGLAEAHPKRGTSDRPLKAAEHSKHSPVTPGEIGKTLFSSTARLRQPDRTQQASAKQTPDAQPIPTRLVQQHHHNSESSKSTNSSVYDSVCFSFWSYERAKRRYDGPAQVKSAGSSGAWNEGKEGQQ
jgi:hypothetical protein